MYILATTTEVTSTSTTQSGLIVESTREPAEEKSEEKGDEQGIYKSYKSLHYLPIVNKYSCHK